MSCSTMLRYVTLCYAVLCYVVLYYVVLCHVKLYYSMLCYVILCTVMSCNVFLSLLNCDHDFLHLRVLTYYGLMLAGAVARSASATAGKNDKHKTFFIFNCCYSYFVMKFTSYSKFMYLFSCDRFSFFFFLPLIAYHKLF
jgi:hypothetical protein